MKAYTITILRAICALTGVGCHFTSNVVFVYSILGFDIHLLPLAVSMLVIHVFILLKLFGKINIGPQWANIMLEVVDALLQALVLAPFFITQKGGFIDLAQTDGAFWIHVLAVSAGIALLHFATYLLAHSSFND